MGYLAVAPRAAFTVAARVQRVKHLTCKGARFSENRIEHVQRLLIAG